MAKKKVKQKTALQEAAGVVSGILLLIGFCAFLHYLGLFVAHHGASPGPETPHIVSGFMTLIVAILLLVIGIAIVGWVLWIFICMGRWLVNELLIDVYSWFAQKINHKLFFKDTGWPKKEKVSE